mgnify:FL=1
MLNDKAKQIFSRQITLPEVGEKGQEELEDTGILVVGMGGLGCPVANYLISSGIGYLTIIDNDKVELSNLSRQPLYTEKDVGNFKVKAAQKFIKLGDKVKFTIRFKGREFQNHDQAKELMGRIKEDMLSVSKIEQEPKLEGRQYSMIFTTN